MIDTKLITSYNENRGTNNTRVLCHAPTVSLNFEQNGNITTCCYNRTYVLGTYPNNNLYDIWHGEPLQKLREYIAANDLSHGCELCLEQLKSGNFAGMRAAGYDEFAQENGTTQPMPKVFEFELSNTCNLECIMCSGYFSSSIRKNREKLPPKDMPYDSSFVKQLEAFIPTLREAKFLGGEPFLIDLYYEIWDRMIEVNPKIKLQITTNGTILNKRVKDTLEVLHTNLILSIDSVNKETYEKIRKNSSFDRVMENLEYFMDYTKRKGAKLYFAVCPIQQNWREMPDLIRFCNDRDIEVYFNTVMNPLGQSLYSMTHLELKEVKDLYETVDLPTNNEIESANAKAFQDMLAQVKSWYQKTLEVYAKSPSPITELKVNAAKAPSADQMRNFVPILLQYMLEIYFIRTSYEPMFENSQHYYDMYVNGLRVYTTKVKMLLDHYPYVNDLKTYIHALKVFNQVINARGEYQLDNEKFDRTLESVNSIMNPEAMYEAMVTNDPTKLIESIMQIDSEDIIPKAIEIYQ